VEKKAQDSKSELWLRMHWRAKWGVKEKGSHKKGLGIWEKKTLI